MAGRYGFKPHGALPVRDGGAVAGQTWKAGDPLHYVGGQWALAALTDVDIKGVAVHDVTVAAADEQILYYPVEGGAEFIASVTGAVSDTAQQGVLYDLAGAVGTFRVDVTATTLQQVEIVKLLDPSGTTNGDVLVKWSQYLAAATHAGAMAFGNTVSAAGLITAAVGLDATTGDITAVAGDVVATAGCIYTGALAGAAGTITADQGLIATAGGVTAVADDIEAQAGALIAATTVEAGTGIESVTGDIVATAGALGCAGTCTAGLGFVATTMGLDAVLGNIQATAGDVISLAGNITAALQVTAGAGLVVTTLDATITLGDVVVQAGDVIVDAGDIVATLGAIEAGTTVTAGTDLESTDDTIVGRDLDVGRDVTVAEETALGGALSLGSVRAVTATGPIADVAHPHDCILLCDSPGGGMTLTLATAAMVDGRILFIVDATASAGANNIMIATEGVETINGANTYVLDVNREGVILVGVATGWYILNLLA